MHDEPKVRFRPPPGFQPPEGLQKGDTFDIVCTLKPEADGYLCLKKLGDAEMPGYEDDHKESQKPDYGEYARGMQGQGGQMQGGQPPQQGGM
jgi:hypothetical protein